MVATAHLAADTAAATIESATASQDASATSSEYEADLEDKSRRESWDDIKPPPLADRDTANGAQTISRVLLEFLRIKKRDVVYDLDAIATQPSVFDGDHAEHYQPSQAWENVRAFDPSFRWTWREESKARRIVDWRIFSWILVMFLALDIDRANINNATADNLLGDLNITQADYNLGNTLSKLGFLVAELPSQLISKRLGPDRWIPIQICIFSILAGAQAFMNGRASFLAFRFLIAVFQGGFIPDCILYLSYYYTKTDLPIRLAVFWSINYIADTITGFLAVGLLQLRGVGGHAGWRYMFGIEGLATLLIGLLSFFMMPASPTQTKSRFRGSGYFTEHQEKIIVNRVLRDDWTKSGMHNREALTIKMIFKSLGDYDLYPLYLIGLAFGIPSYPVKNYLQLSFKDLGFSTVMANLLSVPYTVIAIFLLLIITAVSELVSNRAFVSMAENLWMLPCYIALLLLPDPISGWQYFAIATVLLAFPYVHAIQVGWASRNSGSVRTRTVSASVYNMFVQVSAIIGSNVYQASDKPRYYTGNKAMVGVIAFNLVILYPGAYFYYRARNAYKTRTWNAMSKEEKKHYLQTTTDEGTKRLDFTFAT